MATFDKTKDKEIAKKTLEFENTQITITIYSYDGGEEKIQISRQKRHSETNELIFIRLGRLNKEEAIATAAAIADLVAQMN